MKKKERKRREDSERRREKKKGEVKKNGGEGEERTRRKKRSEEKGGGQRGEPFSALFTVYHILTDRYLVSTEDASLPQLNVEKYFSQIFLAFISNLLFSIPSTQMKSGGECYVI